MFQLTKTEWKQMSSQIVMTSTRPKKALPLAFTEHGVAMLANVLRSKKARLTPVAIVRAFIALKQITVHYRELSIKLKKLEAEYNKQFRDIYEAINYLIEKNEQETAQKKRRRIGFQQEKTSK